MDRILRPKGLVIIHDKRSVVVSIKKFLPALPWQAVAISGIEQGSDQSEDGAVLIIH
ncbi:unnamed protein product [Lupinus luteus]|uniref:Methyltransferase n=1 Tax=Lupinus luteus TaxID=3873 RepID=A0AAV1XK67_LUPLU